jgi:hypothetical protein
VAQFGPIHVSELTWILTVDRSAGPDGDVAASWDEAVDWARARGYEPFSDDPFRISSLGFEQYQLVPVHTAAELRRSHADHWRRR